MPNQAGNGKKLIERVFTDDEVQRKRERIVAVLDSVDKKKDEIKTLTEEQKELRADLKRGYELVEGEELPFNREKRA